MTSTQDLSKGGGEAIRALLKALAPEDAAQLDKTVSSEALDRLSSRLGTILGDPNANGSEILQGQALNEEGLPIVEITESEAALATDQPGFLDDELVPLSTLPRVEQERRRQEIHRFLDMLEEEERQERNLLQQKAIEKSQAALQKRREEAEAEKKRLQSAKEMHKKMGKALVQSSAKGKELEAVTGGIQGDAIEATKVLKKTVKFADSEESLQPQESKEKLGDVSMARLRAKPRSALLNTSLMDPSPMKMTVIERMPTGTMPTPQALAQDSDDESEPPDSPLARPLDDAEEPPSSDESSESTREPEEEMDLDYARHQREVALEYHRRRAKMGTAATEAMETHHIEEYEDLPLKNEPKPALSEFKARRLVSAYSATTPQPMPVENFAVPASGVRTLQNAIREGKLTDDNKLIGPDDNSDDEDVDGAEELKELLRRGEIYNIGPEGHNILHTVPPQPSSSSDKTPPQSVLQSPAQKELPPPKMANPNVSRFKASRPQSARPSTTSSTGTATPSPALSSGVVERRAPSTGAQTTPVPNQSLKMIVESPSFESPLNIPAQAGARPNVLNPSALPAGAFPMIVESPSFPKSQLQPQGSFASNLIVAERVKESIRVPNEVRERTRPDRPPVVVAAPLKKSHQAPAAAAVNEATSPVQGAALTLSDDNAPKKISRFKAERT